MLPFVDAEYAARLEQLRERMDARGIAAAMFTSMYNIASHSKLLYRPIDRIYRLVLTESACVTVYAGPRWCAALRRHHHLYRLAARHLPARRAGGRARGLWLGWNVII